MVDKYSASGKMIQRSSTCFKIWRMGVDQRGAHVVFTENKQTERFASC